MLGRTIRDGIHLSVLHLDGTIRASTRLRLNAAPDRFLTVDACLGTHKLDSSGIVLACNISNSGTRGGLTLARFGGLLGRRNDIANGLASVVNGV